MPIWVDFVPSCWDMTKVKFIAKVVPGATPKSTIASFWNGDIPFVTPADYVTEDHYVGHWARTITEEGMNSCSASLLPSNSVIVSNRAPIGLVAINKVPVCTNQGCKGLVIKSQEYSPEYLYRLLSVADDALNALGNGTTYQELSGKSLSDFVIPKPPLDVQRSIVAFLDSRCKPLNEAIARHRIIIDKLEDYRKAVITKTVTKGLNDNIPMKDVGIGRVKNMPANWSVTKVKFIAKVIPGATPKSTISAFWNGDIPFVTPADYITEDHYIEHWARTITEEGMNSCSTSVLPPNSVIVSNRAPIGLVAINKVPVCTNQGCKGLVVKSREYSPEYLYRLLSVADDALNALGNGTTYQELSGKALSDFVIQKPPLDVQRSIVAFLDSQCESINKAIASHRVIIDKLEEYRRGLIFHAVTGRIDCTGGAR